MLRFKNKSTGETKFVLRDHDTSPISVDQLVLEDDKNNIDDEDDYPVEKSELTEPKESN